MRWKFFGEPSFHRKEPDIGTFIAAAVADMYIVSNI